MTKDPRRGTCSVCKRQRVLLVNGVIDVHAFSISTLDEGTIEALPRDRRGVLMTDELQRNGRCEGIGHRSLEVLEKSRAKSREKREASIVVSREEAAAALDAFIHGRPEYNSNEERQRFIGAALMLYRLAHPGTRPSNLFMWATRKDRRLETYCLFCGHLITILPVGAWIRMAGIDRWTLVNRHAYECALHCLAGLRESVPPGTRKLPIEQLTLGEYEAEFSP